MKASDLITSYGPAYFSPILVFLSNPTEESDPGKTMKELLVPVTVLKKEYSIIYTLDKEQSYRPDSGDKQVATN